MILLLSFADIYIWTLSFFTLPAKAFALDLICSKMRAMFDVFKYILW